MLHDHLRSFWRSLWRNKLQASINIGGLALGLAVFIALTFYVHREFSYDKHWHDGNRIYRVLSSQESPNGNVPAFIPSAPYILGPTLLERYPEAIDTWVQVYNIQAAVKIAEDDIANQTLYYTQPSLLQLLQFESLAGSLEEVMADPTAIAISERVAEQYFGDESPLGKTIEINPRQSGRIPFVVRAIYRLPDPTSFENVGYLALMNPAALPGTTGLLDVWNGTSPQQQPLNTTQYFKLRSGSDAGRLEAELRSYMDQNKLMDFGIARTRFSFQPLQDVHLRTANPFDSGNNNELRLWVFFAIGLLVLLVSGCNFVMLATLRSVDRMRELGVRKTIGGGVGQLMRQYLLDACCHTLLAAVAAIGLLELAKPKMASLLQLPLRFELLEWRSLTAIAVIVVGFTLLSSIYPAWLMAKGKPSQLLRSSSGAVVASGNTLRKLLVCIQFVTVIILLLATAVVRMQIDYTLNRDRGFNLDNMIAVRMNFSGPDSFSKAPVLITELDKLPGVRLAASGSTAPSTIFITPPSRLTFSAADGSVREGLVNPGSVGPRYFEAMSVKVLAGREFSAELDPLPPQATTPAATIPPAPSPAEPPAERKILLNVAALKVMGFATPEQAIGQLLQMDITPQNGQPYKQSQRVIGVVADTQFASMMLPPTPQYYTMTAQGGFIAVKLENGADVAAVTKAAEAVWQSVMGVAQFAPVPPEQLNGTAMLFRENTEALIVTASTLLALVIALLGLYGLVATTVTKRVKEIGVRKVMGAGRSTIVSLLLWQFSLPILVANLVAWPLGLWTVTRWLQRFPYQLDMAQIVAAAFASSLAALLVAWATVGFMAWQAASQKPVLALRYE